MLINPLNLLGQLTVLSLVILFITAVLYDFFTFRHRKKRTAKAVYRCNTCRHIYTVPHRTPLARCPKCGQHNELVKR